MRQPGRRAAAGAASSVRPRRWSQADRLGRAVVAESVVQSLVEQVVCIDTSQ